MTTDYLPLLMRVLDEHHVGTAYYYGYARKDVLDLLLEKLPLGCVQAMILRRGRGISDDEIIDYELQGVTFWDEGGFRGELTVRDSKWSHANQLAEIVAWRGKLPPRIWFLAGDAMQIDRHPAYHWQELGNAVLAIQKVTDGNSWKRVREEHLRHYEISAVYREGLKR